MLTLKGEPEYAQLSGITCALTSAMVTTRRALFFPCVLSGATFTLGWDMSTEKTRGPHATSRGQVVVFVVRCVGGK